MYGLGDHADRTGNTHYQAEQVKEAAEFLIEIMPVMFIPAGVGLLTAWGHTETGMCADHSDHSDHHSCGNDCDRSCHTGSYSYGQKERTEKIMTQFMSNSLFLVQRSA